MMETEQPEKTGTGKRRAVVYLDRGLWRRVRQEQAERDIPMSHVIEEILARHYGEAIPKAG